MTNFFTKIYYTKKNIICIKLLNQIYFAPFVFFPFLVFFLSFNDKHFFEKLFKKNILMRGRRNFDEKSLKQKVLRKNENIEEETFTSN